MQKHTYGWPSCFLYTGAAILHAYLAVNLRSFELCLVAFGMALLVIHAVLRMRGLDAPHYLISLEKIQPRRFNKRLTEQYYQIKDLLIDSVPILASALAFYLGFPGCGAMIWLFLCAYKFGVHVAPSKRSSVLPLDHPIMGRWMFVFFILLLVFGGCMGYVSPTLLEIGIAFLFVLMMVAIQCNIAWLYLTPAIVLLLVFTVWPILNTVRMAFLDGYNSMEAANVEEVVTFSVGIQNFKDVVRFDGFWTALKNTTLLTVITVPVSTLLALLIAVALNSIKPLKKLFQTIFFLPYVTNSIAIGMVFAAMFNRVGLGKRIISQGVVNNLLMLFGAEPVNWINAGSEPWANMFVLIVYIIWNALPFKILVLLGGLQSVNKQYYEAAKVDSTPRWRVFTRITVPLLSPMIAYVVITGFIGGFKEYSSVVGIFGETMGPPGADYRLDTIVGMIYRVIPKMSYGLASAAALVLFLIIFAVTMVNMWVSKKRVHY